MAIKLALDERHDELAGNLMALLRKRRDFTTDVKITVMQGDSTQFGPAGLEELDKTTPKRAPAEGPKGGKGRL